MAEIDRLDPMILGRRVRHYRKRQGLTLDQLGSIVGRPAPYLSLLENGKKEPRINLVLELAAAMDVTLADLLDPSAPTHRDELEVELLQSQSSALFRSLDLPPVKPSSRMDNQTLAHLVGIHEALRERSSFDHAGSDEIRRANGAVARRLTETGGYLEPVEQTATAALNASGYSSDGPFTSRNLIDLASHAGFEIFPIDDMPQFARSMVDLENGRIYIAQRDELRTRQARKAVLQTLARFLLEHETEPDVDTFLMQRMETAYFASAVLGPETAVVARLNDAKRNHDIDVEDIKQLFYVSYEMAAWRTVNLLTRHLEIASHMLVTDELGTVLKGYANDGLPAPRDQHGGLETQRICQKWAARITFDSHDRYESHRQFTDTPAGTYFCATHVETGREPTQAITVGVGFSDARWFRGRNTKNRAMSTCPDPECCRVPPSELTGRWADNVVISARSQSRLLGLMAADPYPTVDLPRALVVVDRHAPI